MVSASAYFDSCSYFQNGFKKIYIYLYVMYLMVFEYTFCIPSFNVSGGFSIYITYVFHTAIVYRYIQLSHQPRFVHSIAHTCITLYIHHIVPTSAQHYAWAARHCLFWLLPALFTCSHMCITTLFYSHISPTLRFGLLGIVCLAIAKYMWCNQDHVYFLTHVYCYVYIILFPLQPSITLWAARHCLFWLLPALFTLVITQLAYGVFTYTHHMHSPL